MSSPPHARRTARRSSAGRRPSVARAALVVLSGVLALQAIAADGMWWDVARGREVLRGSWAPAAALSAGDARGEADWLGGVPWFVSLAVGGPAGLMLARLAGVAVIMACCLRGRHAPRDEARRAAAAAAALVASAPALDPIGGWWDVIGGWLLVSCALPDEAASAARRPDPRGWRGLLPGRGAVGCVVLAVAWANLGPRSLLALTAAAGRPGFLPVIAVALCATPRGPLGPLDSLWTLVPPLGLWLQEGGSPAWLAGHPIAGAAPVPIQFAAWLVLAALAAGPRPTAAGAAAWLGLHGLLVAGPPSLPALVPFAWWLAMHRPCVARGLGAGAVPAAAPARGANARPAAVASRADPPDRDGPPWPARLTAAGIAVVALVAATGPWPGSPWRLGWGLAPRLEYRQLIEPLAACGPDGTAFAFDVRAAGMLVWALPDGPRPWLVPHRALLGGRFVSEAVRAAELRAGWDMRQRDGHGDWGGWWVPLMGRGTRLLVVPDADVETIRRLEPGVFKPLVIDAPVVPYAIAGDPRLSNAILRALADRALVENGAWTFSPPRSIQTDWSIDLWGLVAGRPDPRPLTSRADVFLAMAQPRAALKIALPLRQAGIADCTGRIADATMQIAEAERLALGVPSPLRTAVLARLGVEPPPASALARSLAAAGRPEAADTREQGIMSVASAYLAAGAVAGLDALAAARIDDPWTVAALELEAGRPAAARAVFEGLAAGADPRLAAAAGAALADLPDREPGP